ncbi:hypothetical protein L195_g013677 [Trifolium pratense]|uniref:Uncharacterized protein n=1 Tax=Trifolium pratense TaxID=57577 RepID=A0A2K3PNT1_TRIPR|nr:hypothetical protein L195_g013677 [Trifolium pratense]
MGGVHHSCIVNNGEMPERKGERKVGGGGSQLRSVSTTAHFCNNKDIIFFFGTGLTALGAQWLAAAMYECP